MAEKKAFGCGAKPESAAAPQEEKVELIERTEKKEEIKMIKVGKPAPDFEIPAYRNGDFTSVKLSDMKGKWVMLCFYPGDFTFV